MFVSQDANKRKVFRVLQEGNVLSQWLPCGCDKISGLFGIFLLEFGRVK
jgi:hypothetical protein